MICTNHIIFTQTPSSSNFSSSLACLFMSFLQAQLSRSCLRPLRHLDDDDDDNEQLCCWEYSENIHTDHGPGGKHKGQMTEKTRRRSRPGHPSMTVTLKTQGRTFGHQGCHHRGSDTQWWHRIGISRRGPRHQIMTLDRGSQTFPSNTEPSKLKVYTRCSVD